MTAPSWLSERGEAVQLVVLVQPRASRSRVLGEHDGRLKIALAAPPVDGEANQALLDFLRESLGVRRSDVELLEGHASRRKRLLVRGVAARDIMARLAR